MTGAMEYARLHPDMASVSALSLGSWNTYPRMEFDDLRALLHAAIDLGINYFDVGYYWDNPHTEVLFGHAMRMNGTPRDAYMIAQKLWLWDYPRESFATQVEKSLSRLGDDYVDVLMVSRPTPEVVFEDYLSEIRALLDRGLARAWGVTNWAPSRLAEAYPVFEAVGMPLPVTLQSQYSIARRDVVEDPAYDALFASRGLTLQPADSLEGGILAGKLDRDRINPDDVIPPAAHPVRNIARDAGGLRPAIRRLYPKFAAAASDLGITASQFALAYVLNHQYRSTVLMGVSAVSQLEENVEAVHIARALRSEIAAAAQSFDFGRAGHPKLFSPSQPNSTW